VKLSLGTLAVALLVVAGCTHDTSRGAWTLEEGTIVETTFSMEKTQVDHGAEDSTTYHDTIAVCDAVSERPDLLVVRRAGTRWLVWGLHEGIAPIRLVPCADEATTFIDVKIILAH
jgi:hypothetical protein